MKHKGLACLAAVAISALAALPFTGRAQDSATLFHKTTSRLEQGGITYSYTNGAATYKMVEMMFDSVEAVLPENPQMKEILNVVRTSFDELGFQAILGTGTSIKETGDYYRCIDFEYAPKADRKGLIWDLLGSATASNGAAPELKLTSPKSAIAVSFRMEPGAAYTYIDKKLRDLLPEEIIDEIDQQLSALNDSGIQPDKLLKSISGITFYVDSVEEDGKLAKFIEEADDLEEDEIQDRIMDALPHFAFIFTTKNDLCWKALNNFISQADPDMVKDERIVPVKGLAVFQAGNYLVVTNEEADLRKRIDGKGTDLNSNAEFAKMLELVSKDFSNFAWVSEDYFTSITNIVKMVQRSTDEDISDVSPFMFEGGMHSALGVAQFNADGILSTTITSDLQIALLDSKTIPGVIAGMLPYFGPVVKVLLQFADEDDFDFGFGNGNDDMDAAIRGARMILAQSALEQLKGAKAPAGTVFFAIGEESPVFVKWNAADESFENVPEDSEEDEFPYVFVTAPADAAKADTPSETVVFFEDPTENADGVHFVFGDDSIQFLEGDFDTYSEAAEAAVNSFDISDDAAAKLLKKAADVDKMFE